MWELDRKESWALKNWCFWTAVLEKTLWESLELQGDPISLSWRKSILNIHWKDWYWSWNSNTLATSCEELTHLKRPWCWERLKVGKEGDDRRWDGWMASPTQWIWVWVNSGVYSNGVCEELDTTERLNWTELKITLGVLWLGLILGSYWLYNSWSCQCAPN